MSEKNISTPVSTSTPEICISVKDARQLTHPNGEAVQPQRSRLVDELDFVFCGLSALLDVWDPPEKDSYPVDSLQVVSLLSVLLDRAQNQVHDICKALDASFGDVYLLTPQQHMPYRRRPVYYGAEAEGKPAAQNGKACQSQEVKS